MQLKPGRCGMVLAHDALLSTLICLIKHPSLSLLRIQLLNIHLTSLRQVTFQMPNTSHLQLG